jgi:hypothetical protein
MKIFAEQELSEYLAANSNRLSAEVEAQSEDYILNVNETQFVNFLVSRYMVENLTLNIKDAFVSSAEKEIPAEDFPRGFNVRPGKTYKKSVITYHIPYEGNSDLLLCTPSAKYQWTAEVTTEGSCVCFEIANFRDDPEEIKRTADQEMRPLYLQFQSVRSEVESYNSRLQSLALGTFQSRKQKILRNNDLLAKLGVPLKRRQGMAQTFSVPSPQTTKKIGISKPEVRQVGFKPEPSLDESTYMEILQVINDVGKQFERMPSTYSGKSEEDLRDHFLLFLEPRFEGSATGETFNKSGRTDILLRYKGSNVFIAECKFWRGSKGYLEAITQLLGYLTWRDSKAAVILFVENRDLSSVIREVEKATPEHRDYLGRERAIDSTWIKFRFHIPGDPNREVQLSVLLFHFPGEAKRD